MNKIGQPWKILAAAAIVAALAMPFGCTSSGGPTTTTSTPPLTQGPSVTITQPSFDFDPAHPGERPLISGPANITIQVSVEGFTLVQPGQGTGANSGHLIYYMDVFPPTIQGQTALTQSGSYVATAATSNTWQNVTPGPHIFWVMLVNTDNTPLSTPVFDSRQVLVINPPSGTVQPTAAPAASVHIITPEFDFDPSHPGERPLITGPDITIGVQVIGFNLVPSGQSGTVPFGHLVYYLDVVPPTNPGQSALSQEGSYFSTTSLTHTWQNVPNGPHVFWVQLVDTNNMPLTPIAVANITLIVLQP